MSNLLLLLSTGHAKIKSLSVDVWSGETGAVTCGAADRLEAVIPCPEAVIDLNNQFAGLTCAELREKTGSQFPTNECLPFNGQGGDWRLTCPHASDASPEDLHTHDVRGLSGTYHALRIHCEDYPTMPDDQLGTFLRAARSAAAVENPPEAKLGSAPSPSPSPSSDNKTFLYVGVPIICAVVALSLCGGAYFFCYARKDKKDLTKTPNDEPLQAPVDAEDPKAELDNDDSVEHFIDEEIPATDHGPAPVIVATDVGTAEEAAEAAQAPEKKKSKRRFMLFGKKKKSPETEEDEGFVAKSHVIPMSADEDEKSDKTVDEAEKKKAETPRGPAWGDDQPLEETKCADARDASAGYPVLDGQAPSGKPTPAKPNNDLF